MKIKKILWKYVPHNDGTCDVKIYVYRDGRKKNFSTGYSILPTDWDDKKRMVKNSHPLAKSYNDAIDKLRLELEEHLLHGGTFENFRNSHKQISLIDYCKEVIQNWEDGLLPLTASTIKNYRATFRRLNEFADMHPSIDLSLSGLNLDFYKAFSAFLRKYANCGLPGISKHIKIIKRLMGMSLEENLHSNTVFREKAFKRPRTKASTKIYLNTDEIAQLEGLDLSGQPALERERDRFLLAYWLLMRFSDVCLVRKEWLFQLNGKLFLRYTSTKTKVESTLPVKASAMTMIEKYNYDFSFSSNVQANRELKTVAAMAGINANMLQDGRNGPKSSFVTTHTARRSAATNLYLEGVSLKMIGDLGGWKDLQSLRTYLRASGLDTAQVAVDLDFFN